MFMLIVHILLNCFHHTWYDDTSRLSYCAVELNRLTGHVLYAIVLDSPNLVPENGRYPIERALS